MTALVAGAGLASILSAGSAVVGVVSALETAGANRDAAEYNAQIQERDRVIAQQNTTLKMRQAAIDAQDKSRENRRIMASIRATYGASGFEIAGSPLDVLEDTAVEQALDVRRTEFEGRVVGREGALQDASLAEGAELSRREARGAGTAGAFLAVGKGLAGAGNVLQRTG